MIGGGASTSIQRQTNAQLSVAVLIGTVTVLGVAATPVYSTAQGAAVVATAALLIFAAARAIRAPRGSDFVTGSTAVASGVFLAFGYFGIHAAPSASGIVVVGARLLLAGILALSLVPALRFKRWTAAVGIVMIATAILVVGAWTINAFPKPSIDVFDLHVAAADVIRAGGNLYQDVAVVDGSPLMNGSETLAYPYPPITALIFSLATWSFGDPRWASVLAMATAGLLMLVVVRRVAAPLVSWVVALTVAFAANPTWPFVVRFAWTDTIGIPFLIGGALLWRRSALASGALIGFGFATKQYYIVALPLLLLAKDQDGMRRFWAAATTAVVLTAPAMIGGFSAPWAALVRFHLTRPPRLDGSSVASLGIDVPSAIVAVVVVGLAGWFARQIRSSGQFMIGLGAVLAALFALGSQAFANYWLVIVSVVLLGLALGSPEGRETTL